MDNGYIEFIIRLHRPHNEFSSMEPDHHTNDQFWAIMTIMAIMGREHSVLGPKTMRLEQLANLMLAKFFHYAHIFRVNISNLLNLMGLLLHLSHHLKF